MFCYHCSMASNRKRRRQSAYSSEGYIPQTRSYQTRIAVYEGIDRCVGDAALSAYAALYGKVQHKLFADVAAGRSAVLQKSRKLQLHHLARQQLERPVHVSFGWTAARDGNQVRFLLAVQLALPARPWLVIDGGLKSFLDGCSTRCGLRWTARCRRIAGVSAFATG